LYCWPCIRRSENSVWCKLRYRDLKNLSRSIGRHGKSKEHISSKCKFQLLGKLNVATAIDDARKIHIESPNFQVKHNGDIIKRLIDCTIFLSFQNLAFRGHDESESSLNKGNFKEFMSFLSKYDPNLKTFLDNKSVFSGTSKTIQNEILESITAIVNKEIEKEISNAPFFLVANR
jgi:hypothetical protein